MEILRINIEKTKNGFIVKTYPYYDNDFVEIYVFETLDATLNFVEEQFKNK
jgi:hypothetical protein